MSGSSRISSRLRLRWFSNIIWQIFQKSVLYSLWVAYNSSYLQWFSEGFREPETMRDLLLNIYLDRNKITIDTVAVCADRILIYL